MSPSKFPRFLLAAGLPALFAACASREVPAHYPKASAASPDATAAAPADVTQTLAPAPLAREASSPALAPVEAASEGHEGHHGHH